MTKFLMAALAALTLAAGTPDLTGTWVMGLQGGHVVPVALVLTLIGLPAPLVTYLEETGDYDGALAAARTHAHQGAVGIFIIWIHHQAAAAVLDGQSRLLWSRHASLLARLGCLYLLRHAGVPHGCGHRGDNLGAADLRDARAGSR